MEIDVSKCEYKGGIECHIRDYPILNCVDVKIEDCHYKQLQQLKVENEELKNSLGLANKYLNKYKQCLDEIEEIIEECNTNDGRIRYGACYETCKYYDLCNCDTDSFILNIIKQAEEGVE